MSNANYISYPVMLYCKRCGEMSYHNIEALSQRAAVTENLCFYQNQLEPLQTDRFFDLLKSNRHNFSSNLRACTFGNSLRHSATELTSFFRAPRVNQNDDESVDVNCQN